uniref:Uncharacterized protein n=1 Tax=Avena sativa TaxID=4498 RepID=A0ACD5U2V1_AVESA
MWWPSVPFVGGFDRAGVSGRKLREPRAYTSSTLRFRPTMSSQRLGRHQRRASQSVFALPENFAALDDVPASDGEHRKASVDGGSAEQQQGARPSTGRHRRAMSMATASSRDLEMIKEDIGGYNYKIGA